MAVSFFIGMMVGLISYGLLSHRVHRLFSVRQQELIGLAGLFFFGITGGLTIGIEQGEFGTSLVSLICSWGMVFFLLMGSYAKR